MAAPSPPTATLLSLPPQPATRAGVCPALKVNQIHAIIANYAPDELDAEGAPPDLTQFMGFRPPEARYWALANLAAFLKPQPQCRRTPLHCSETYSR